MSDALLGLCALCQRMQPMRGLLICCYQGTNRDSAGPNCSLGVTLPPSYARHKTQIVSPDAENAGCVPLGMFGLHV